MLRNTHFESLRVGEAFTQKTTTIAPDWQIEFRHKDDYNALQLRADAGYPVFHAQNLTGWVRLVQPLDASHIPFGQACQCEIQLAGAHSDALEWVSLLCQKADGKVVHHSKIAQNVKPNDKAQCFDFSVAAPEQGAQYFFAMQCSQDVGSLGVAHISIAPIEQEKAAVISPVPNVSGQFDSSKKINIAWFWKQNDSGIYGRRQDMLLHYLAQHERVGKIVHFDAPISLSKLNANASLDEAAAYSQGNLVVQNTIERFLKLQDDATIFRRTFVYDDAGAELLGHALPTREAFAQFVSDSLKQTGVDDNVMAWVTPICPEFMDIQQALQFPFICADVIDNELAWTSSQEQEAQRREQYQTLLELADIAFVNCEPMHKVVSAWQPNVHVVPNGAEAWLAAHDWNMPSWMQALPKPIIGYCGNLSSRIDIALLEHIAKAHPEWSLVLIGSAHLNQDVLRLQTYDNVHCAGVMRYPDVCHAIAQFDCAIIPHEVNAITQHMNPLKAYVYTALGVPIVSTPVANLDELSEQLHVANDHDAFVEAIESALQQPHNAMDVSRISWEQRVEAILGAI